MVSAFLTRYREYRIRAKHVSGHSLTENVSSYAGYLESRIRAYRDLKHDIIRIQNESNREDRMSGGESSRPTNQSNSSRNKSGNGKKLRQMTVEKGLLRETKSVQRQIDALLQCKVCFPILRFFTAYSQLFVVLLGQFGR
jgi:hypothetical protein